MLRIVNIVGTRPNLMKMSALLAAQRARPHAFEPMLVDTGQHRDPAMSGRFFEELELPSPDVSLGVEGSGPPAQQIGRMLIQLDRVLRRLSPDLVVVVGDVNSTAAGALAASMLDLPVAHVEAGLRSFDRTMPEELNRTIVDAVSDLLFVSECSGVENLRREGRPETAMHHVGNVMIDCLVRFRARARERDPAAVLGVAPPYAVLTLHRPSNVDRPSSLSGLLRTIAKVCRYLPVIFPIHPRTRDRLAACDLEQALHSIPDLFPVSPLGYLDMLALMERADLVLTDSGGVQEETTFLGVPCLTLRDNTERPATVSEGTNRVVGTRPQRVLAEVERVVLGERPPRRCPALWDGRAAERIADVLERFSSTTRAVAAGV
ncbi:MAG TPA: UDP-N-acetylglucosamine 2-epimerase (non-hydrolyzing) [Candidatus Acidoferrales bacterium]|nr:UDP-N-acetylglucosamine 2-epimerase (non-hydrolyzing) [Candidatus Acidoferrales bacterium]